MLVLSRRPSEKILFPNVGISVEIIQTKGNTVRVGIEAPEDIRILRGELEQTEPHCNPLKKMDRVAISSQTNADHLDASQLAEINGRIEEISLALALAQNQQRQGLSEHVEVALEQAIDRLTELKQQVLEPVDSRDAVVCEPSVRYVTRRAETKLEFGKDSLRHFRLEFEFSV